MTEITNTEAVSLTIRKWCKQHNLSPATFYKLQRLGHAPRTITLPGTRFVRVTESAESWQRRMEAVSATQKAKRERALRIEQATRAAEISAAGTRHVSKRQRRSR